MSDPMSIAAAAVTFAGALGAIIKASLRVSEIMSGLVGLSEEEELARLTVDLLRHVLEAANGLASTEGASPAALSGVEPDTVRLRATFETCGKDLGALERYLHVSARTESRSLSRLQARVKPVLHERKITRLRRRIDAHRVHITNLLGLSARCATSPSLGGPRGRPQFNANISLEHMTRRPSARSAISQRTSARSVPRKTATLPPSPPRSRDMARATKRPSLALLRVSGSFWISSTQ